MTRTLTDHDSIREWAEQRGAQPACVKGTGGAGDPGMIRLDFEGYSGEESLAPIEWNEWFRKFDDSGLALIVDDSGRADNFNKLVRRKAKAGSSPRTAASKSAEDGAENSRRTADENEAGTRRDAADRPADEEDDEEFEDDDDLDEEDDEGEGGGNA